MKTLDKKVVILGAPGVGKTSLVHQFNKETFHGHTFTLGAAFFTCKLNFESIRVRLQVWDTAGQERFKSMAPMYYRNANAAMLVFDLTDVKSFASIKCWVQELRSNVEETMVLIVIGNKSDLEDKRQVDSEEGRFYADNIGASYHETSAVLDEGVDNVFLTIATELIKLSEGEEFASSLKLASNSSSFTISNSDLLLTPAMEEGFQNTSIAHGIYEKPYCC